MLDSIQNFIAKNLLSKTHLKKIISTIEETEKESTPIGVGERVEKETMVVTDNQTQENQTKIKLAAKKNHTLEEQDFVKAEKNLIALGFFSVSKRDAKTVSKGKTLGFSQTIDGKKVEAQVTIAPNVLYGMPTTADQDKYLAFQKIIGELKTKNGDIQNPIPFTSAELLGLLGTKKDAGKNYDEIENWLKRMTLTGIVSEGAVYFAGKKTWATDIFHVFERAILFGKEMPDGSVAEKNYVWLSSWQLENINNNYLLPIDIDSYKKLKTPIAKALALLLQIWLYASRDEGKFEKLYSDICNHLGITCYTKLSYIQGRFCPSLDELKKEGYLEKWQLVQTADKKGYKIIFYHGQKFYHDRIKQLERKQKSLEPAKPKKEKPPTPVIDIAPEPPEPSEQTQPTTAGESISSITSDSLPVPAQEKPSNPEIPTPTPPQNPQISRLASTLPSDLPPSDTQLPPDAQNALYSLINHFGVIEKKALELVTSKLGETQDQLAAFKYRYPKEANQPANKAGVIIAAIETGYQLPEAYLTDKKQQEQKRRKEEQAKIREACTICNGKIFVNRKNLETGERGAVVCKHTEEFRQEIFIINQTGKMHITTVDGQPILAPELVQE